MARFAEAAAELTLVIVLLAVVVARKQKENTAQFNALVNPLWPRIEKALDMQAVEKDSWIYRSLKRDFKDNVLDGLRPKSNQLDGTTQAAVEDVVNQFIAKWKGPIHTDMRTKLVEHAFDDFVKQDADKLAGTLRSSLNEIFQIEARQYQGAQTIGLLHAIQRDVIDPLNERMEIWNPDNAFNLMFTIEGQRRLFMHLYLRDVRDAIERIGRIPDMNAAGRIKLAALEKVNDDKRSLESALLNHSRNDTQHDEAFYSHAFQIYEEESRIHDKLDKMDVDELAKQAWGRVKK